MLTVFCFSFVSTLPLYCHQRSISGKASNCADVAPLLIIMYDVLTHSTHFNWPLSLARTCDFSAHGVNWLLRGQSIDRNLEFTLNVSMDPPVWFMLACAVTIPIKFTQRRQLWEKREKCGFTLWDPSLKREINDMELQMAGRCRHYCASVLQRSLVLYHISLYNTALVITCKIYYFNNNKTSSLLLITYVLTAAMWEIGLWKCSRWT